MQQLYRVLYCSRNVMPGTPEQIEAGIRSILAASRRNNGRAGLTGGLLFTQGCFAQVLEGPIEQVMEAYERIQCDERHRDVTVLQAGPVAEREFASWSMGFAGAAGSRDPLVGLEVPDAMSGRNRDGAGLLAMLKDVIVREEDRLQLA